MSGFCWDCARRVTPTPGPQPLCPATSDLTGSAEHCCPRCGENYVHKFPGPTCWECEARDRQAAEWQEERRTASGIAPRHAEFRKWHELTGPEPYQRAVAVVRRFFESGDTVLAIIGTRGSGKTQVAAVGVWQCIASGRSAVMTTAVGVLADLKRRYGDGGPAESAWLEHWTRPYLLVIDEIAERLDTDHARIMLTTLVDARYAKMKPTVLIGNLTPEQFSECVGGSIADRCTEGAGGLVRFDGWASFRGQVNT